MLAGLVGLTLGCYLSQKLKPRYPKVDPIICGVGLFISAPLLLGTTFAVTYNIALCYVLLFLGQVALNLNWSIVSDILLVRNKNRLSSIFFFLYKNFNTFSRLCTLLVVVNTRHFLFCLNLHLFVPNYLFVSLRFNSFAPNIFTFASCFSFVH
jgi:hypothetical protein